MMRVIRAFYVFFLLCLGASQALLAASPSAGEPERDRLKFKDDEFSDAEAYGTQLWREISGEKAAVAKRWKIKGLVGYAYDDNVPLAPDNKAFRTGSVDKNAPRFYTDNAVGYEFYRGAQTRAEIEYGLYQSLHADGLNEFNFQNHEVTLRGSRQLRAFGRASELILEYTYAHGILQNDTFSSQNTWRAVWSGEWADAFPLQVYQTLSARDFRDQGIEPSRTSRDGFYTRTGFVQGYQWKPDVLIYAGYEFDVDNASGNDFDALANGAQLGWRSPLVEKLRLDLRFFFQNSNYYRMSGSPHRNDRRFQYEVRVSRPIGRHFEAQIFYRYTVTDTAHDDVFGFYEYDRNIYGTELHYRF